jgi:hypothetical protein
MQDRKTPIEWYKENYSPDKTRDALILKCISETGRNRDICRHAYTRFIRKHVWGASLSTAPITKQQKPAFGISEETLRAKYDIAFIVKKNVKELQEGVYLTEPEFIKLCNLRGIPGYRAIIDDLDFSAYKGKAGGNIYWSHPKSIQKMKSEGVLT